MMANAYCIPPSPLLPYIPVPAKVVMIPALFSDLVIGRILSVHLSAHVLQRINEVSLYIPLSKCL